MDQPLTPTRKTRLRAAAWAVAIVSLLVVVSACKPPAERADPARPVDVVLLTTPARVGPAAVEVRLTVDGAPADGATIRIVGDMTHAGMVPVVAPTVVGLGGGVYRSEGFAFDMAGDWVITAEVRYADGVSRQGSLAVNVAR
jgi:hypothetical protein